MSARRRPTRPQPRRARPARRDRWRATPPRGHAPVPAPKFGCTTAFRSSIESQPAKGSDGLEQRAREIRDRSGRGGAGGAPAFGSCSLSSPCWRRPRRRRCGRRRRRRRKRSSRRRRSFGKVWSCAARTRRRAPCRCSKRPTGWRAPREPPGQLGLCELELGSYAEAELYLSEALATPNHPWIAKNRTTLKRQLDAARANVGELSLTVSPVDRRGAAGQETDRQGRPRACPFTSEKGRWSWRSPRRVTSRCGRSSPSSPESATEHSYALVPQPLAAPAPVAEAAPPVTLVPSRATRRGR